jgi:phosphoribosylformimino-5-aminoimidazole carboxamide ribotide isomerase
LMAMSSRTKFRPCIDLHGGRVKQIVGSSLSDDGIALVENFVAPYGAEYYSALFCCDSLAGGHVIKLGKGNDQAALAALQAYPGGMQLGGGVCPENACQWLDAGAAKVIVTSWLFDEHGRLKTSRLDQLVSEVGADRLVIDLSCRRIGGGWRVVTNRWQTITDFEVNHQNLNWLAVYSQEFLIHAADVEGLCNGFDSDLVKLLGNWGKAPVTYAGGITSLSDIQAIENLSQGRVDFTVGSALDLFGGTGVRYRDLVAWNQRS